jgi:hypothetical protein
MNKLKSFVSEHPKVAVLLAYVFVAVAVENYVRVCQWAETVEQLNASEALGG